MTFDMTSPKLDDTHASFQLAPEPWSLTEHQWNLEQARFRESLFSLANEFAGVRGNPSPITSPRKSSMPCARPLWNSKRKSLQKIILP